MASHLHADYRARSGVHACSIRRLSVQDKKGNALMVPIHRWLVRGKPTEAVEGKLRWKYVQQIRN